MTFSDRIVAVVAAIIVVALAFFAGHVSGSSPVLTSTRILDSLSTLVRVQVRRADSLQAVSERLMADSRLLAGRADSLVDVAADLRARVRLLEAAKAKAYNDVLAGTDSAAIAKFNARVRP